MPVPTPVPLPTPIASNSTPCLPSHRGRITDPVVQNLWRSTLSQMRAEKALPFSDLDQIESDISQGVSLPLQCQPPPTVFNNTPSVAQNADLVRARLADYIEFGALEELPADSIAPHGIQPLHVVLKPGKKPRLCIDLSRNLNQFLDYRYFSYSKVDDAVELSSPNCWFGKLDLSNCFLTFPLHPEAVKFFYFRFENKLYKFTHMPFGLRTAPLVCTLLLSVPAFAMSKRGCKFVRYLDDFFFIASSREELSRMLKNAKEVFTSFGLIVNEDKTEGPVQSISFLGVQINSIEKTVCCTPERVKELTTLLTSTLTKRIVRRRDAESIVGKLSFAAQVLPGARPFMRSMIDSIHRCTNRYTPVRIDSCFRSDIDFWLENLSNWNGKQLWRSARSVQIVIATDASLQGFGFYIDSVPEQVNSSSWPANLQIGSCFYGSYDVKHAEYHSSHRKIAWCELLAILAAVATYGPHIQNQNLLLLVDNNTDVAIINRQATKSPLLSQILKRLFKLSLDFNFSISAKHFPGSLNVIADFLSRPSLHKSDPLTHAHVVIPEFASRLCICSPVSSITFHP